MEMSGSDWYRCALKTEETLLNNYGMNEPMNDEGKGWSVYCFII